MRRAPVTLALLSILASVTAVVAPGTTGSVTAAAPPSKRLYIVTDSVGLGAENWFPGAFPGWDVILDGDAGEFTETMARKYVAPRAVAGQLGDYAIVATGYNYPYWDPARFDRSIDEMIATLAAGGVRHVLWVTLREVKPEYVSPGAWRQIQPYYWYFPTVNDHLEAALSRHPNLSLIDWAAVADRPGLTYDAIHLNPTGAALYTSIARQAVIDAQTAAPDGSVTRIAIPHPEGVDAVAINLTTVAPRAGGFLTAFACDAELPLVSNHNHSRDQIVAHAAIVPVSASGEICVYNRAATNLVVDITGRFGDGAEITDFMSTRLIDTRDRGARQPALVPLAVDVGGVSGAPVVVNVTAVDSAGPGWVRAAPCDSNDTTSTLNFDGASAVPNVAVVVPGAEGTICVTSSTDTHLVVDRFMTFGGATGIHVTSPARMLDTRESQGAPLDEGAVAVLDAGALGVGALTTGVMLNLTAVEPVAAGFLSAYPCLAGRPDTSNLNYGPGDVVANFVIVEPDADGDVCVYTHAATHVVVDLLGSASTGFRGGAPERLLDTRSANLPPDWP